MTISKDASPESRRLHNEANQRSKARRAKRIENKRLYEHALAEPEYYNNIEQELRKHHPELEVEHYTDKTTLRWKGPNGNNIIVRDDTLPGALLKAWRSEIPPEF